MRVRYESFGGIISLENPPALIYVDKEFMTSLGYGRSKLWKKKRDYLSAPTEVHFSVTNECPLECKHCYVGAGEKLSNELTLKEMKSSIDLLAEMGVFHIAFGGGEPFARDDFQKIVEYTKRKGIIPNVTTNGYYITERVAKWCRIFGVIHVSMDGVGKKYRDIRGIDGFKIADKAVELLHRNGCRVGINCVIVRSNFDHLPTLIKYAKSKGVKEVLFLRYKPSGRGGKHYKEVKLTRQQNENVFPYLVDLAQKYEILVSIDCSFIPMVCHHEPRKEELDFFGVQGCEGGNTLAGVTPDGKFNACSFCHDYGGHIFELKEKWDSSPHFKKFREWGSNAPEPCKSCRYLDICRGGCHVVSEILLRDFSAPDPECPKVADFLIQ